MVRNRFGVSFFALLVALIPAVSSANVVAGKVILKTPSGQPVGDSSNVVVFLDGVKGSFKPPSAHASMASRDKVFVPAVLPVMQGTTVDFPNDDVIFHNVFSLSKTKPFDLGLYKKGESKGMTFDTAGLVKVYCNIHEKMVAYIVILENPYFALTDSKGRFEIKDVPPGQFDVIAWHRFGDQIKKRVDLTGKIAHANVEFQAVKGQEIDFDMIQKDASIKHKNKWGKEYKDKY